jgi:excisionase family DNA binding protein
MSDERPWFDERWSGDGPDQGDDYDVGWAEGWNAAVAAVAEIVKSIEASFQPPPSGWRSGLSGPQFDEEFREAYVRLVTALVPPTGRDDVAGPRRPVRKTASDLGGGPGPTKFSYRPGTLAAETGLSVSTIRKLIRSGKLEARHVGRAVIIPGEAARDLIDNAAAFRSPGEIK